MPGSVKRTQRQDCAALTVASLSTALCLGNCAHHGVQRRGGQRRQLLLHALRQRVRAAAAAAAAAGVELPHACVEVRHRGAARVLHGGNRDGFCHIAEIRCRSPNTAFLAQGLQTRHLEQGQQVRDHNRRKPPGQARPTRISEPEHEGWRRQYKNNIENDIHEWRRAHKAGQALRVDEGL